MRAVQGTTSVSLRSKNVTCFRPPHRGASQMSGAACSTVKKFRRDRGPEHDVSIGASDRSQGSQICRCVVSNVLSILEPVIVVVAKDVGKVWVLATATGYARVNNGVGIRSTFTTTKTTTWMF